MTAEITISSIELQDLQTQVTALGDNDAIIASEDPVGAAESVVRAFVLRIEKGNPPPIQDCHTMAPEPMGFDPQAPECMACFDKLTCMMALHRVGRERFPIRVGSEVVPPVDQEMANYRVPMVGVMVDPGDGLDGLSKAALMKRARDMGAQVHQSMKISAIKNVIRRAKGVKPAPVIDVEAKPVKKPNVTTVGGSAQPAAKIDVEKVQKELEGKPKKQPPKKKPKVKSLKKGPKKKGGGTDWVAKSGHKPGTVLVPRYAKYAGTGATLEVTKKDFVLRFKDYSETHCKNLRAAMKALAEIKGLDLPHYSGNTFWKPEDE